MDPATDYDKEMKTNIVINVLEWNQQGTRKPSRPRLPWMNSLLNQAEKLGKTCKEVKQTAADRNSLKAFVEALCSTAE